MRNPELFIGSIGDHLGNDSLFSPTDVFRIPAGVPLLRALVDQGLEQVLRDSVYLEEFLSFNKLAGPNVKFSSETMVLGHRPDLVHAQDKHRMRSLHLFYFQFHKLGLENKISGLPSGAKVLDIGAGYGRAMLEMKSQRPDLQLSGIGLPGESIAPGVNIPWM